MAKEWKGILEQDPDLKEYCYNKICNIYIMKYKGDSEGIDPDEVTVDDELPE